MVAADRGATQGKALTWALVPLLLLANSASGGSPPKSEGDGPHGRLVGAGIQVDWDGRPLEIATVEVVFHPDGGASIVYPTLGCRGLLTPLGPPERHVYRETIADGIDRCPSGATVTLRPEGDRWAYTWSIRDRSGATGLDVRAQGGGAPDGAWMRSGMLTYAPPAPGRFAPLDLPADPGARAARVEASIAPAVVVRGEALPGETLAQRMAELHVAGVSVAVIHEGRIDWARGYGLARPDGATVTPDTLFQAASISKPVTGLVAARLAQDGVVDLDRDVNAYLKGWSIPRDDATPQRLVTLRRLLTHTAGATVHGFAGYEASQPLPDEQQILTGAAPANSGPVRIDTTPGVLWRYSGGGYVVVRKALEDATATPFAELARRTVLQPAGMMRSTFAQPLPDADVGAAAWPFGADGKPLKEGAHVYPELAPDGLWTTASDLARLAMAVQNAIRGGPEPLLSKEEVRQVLQPGGLAGWGLGWALGGSPEAPYFWHSGSNAGFKSMLVAYGAGEGAVVMTNSDAGEKLAADVIRTIAYDYGWPDFRPTEIDPVAVSASRLDGLVGQYRLGRYGRLSITRAGDRLFAQTPDRARFRIFPISAERWFAVDPDGFTPNPTMQLTFQLSGRQAAAVTVWRAGGADIGAPELDLTAPRLGTAEAQQLQAALLARRSAKTPEAASEPALRSYIAGLQSGQPDYRSMGPGAAYITRQLLLNFAEEVKRLGALKRLDFKGVGPDGADEFIATFDHGQGLARILLARDGKVEQALLVSPGFL